MKEIKVKNVRALIREETSDELVVNEVIKHNTYKKLNILPSDIVIDFGLNIGMFTISALKKGAAMVYSYEPEIDNFQLAECNIKLNYFGSNYILYNTAVVGNHDRLRPFSINIKKNKGMHSLIAKRGRKTITVKCENINEILEKKKPTVIKMDIEGGEYECIKAIKNFNGIREFILEFHHAHLNDIKTREKYKEIINILKNHFDEVDYRAEPKKAWATLIYCKNNEISEEKI